MSPQKPDTFFILQQFSLLAVTYKPFPVKVNKSGPFLGFGLVAATVVICHQHVALAHSLLPTQER